MLINFGVNLMCIFNSMVNIGRVILRIVKFYFISEAFLQRMHNIQYMEINTFTIGGSTTLPNSKLTINILIKASSIFSYKVP